MKKELLVKGIKYYISCTCGKTSFFEEYSKKKECPYCQNENEVKMAAVVDSDEDITTYKEKPKIVGLKIKTRRN